MLNKDPTKYLFPLAYVTHGNPYVRCKYFMPLKDFFTSYQYTTFIKNVYNEYRLVKATYKFSYLWSTLAVSGKDQYGVDFVVPYPAFC